MTPCIVDNQRSASSDGNQLASGDERWELGDWPEITKFQNDNGRLRVVFGKALLRMTEMLGERCLGGPTIQVVMKTRGYDSSGKI